MVAEHLLETSDKTRGTVALVVQLGSTVIPTHTGIAVHATIVVVFGKLVIMAEAG
jgi:hypothetical protein